jgi:PAS domain S-box-containing protein
MGTGLMPDMVRAFDWASTPLGPIDQWSEVLVSHLNQVLFAPAPAILSWGPEFTFFYNEAAIPSLQGKHPHALGASYREVYKEVWHLVGHDLEDCYYRGVTSVRENMLIPLLKDGRLEDGYFTYYLVPIFEDGKIVGIYDAYHDETETVLGRRRIDALAAQLGDVLEATTDAIISLDRNWRVTYLNNRGKEILAPRGDILGENLWEKFPEAVYEGSPYIVHYYRTMHEGVPAEFEAYYAEPLNRWLRILARPSKDGIIIFFRDVTEEKLQADAVRASEERYRVLTELNPQALWTADAQGRVLYANRRFLDYIGRDSLPEDGEEYLGHFHEDDRERVVQGWSHCMAIGGDYIMDVRLLRAADGAARWWHLRAAPVRNESGAIQQWLGVATDVHENYIAAERLREQYAEIDRQKRELEAIYRGSPIGMSLYEPKDLRLVRVNERQAEILGLPVEEALGKRVEELAPGMTSSHAMIRRAAEGQPMVNRQIEGVLPTRPGEHRYFNVNYTPVFSDDGSVQAIAGATIEITQQKRAETALIQAEKLAAVGRLASSIAHEINNPLESVTNLIYLARLHAVHPDAQQFLAAADQELRRVSIITNQTLRFHKQSTRPQPVSCTDLFLGVLSIFEGRFKNSKVKVEKRKRADRSVVCFEGDIRQVLSNLVSNALDAMGGGGRLLVRSREAVDWKTGRRGVVLTVADTGVGMDAQTQSRIFEAFFTTKGYNGTGLGLWVSAEIVERHHGRIHVRSSQREHAHGTVVTLFLPFDMAPQG